MIFVLRKIKRLIFAETKPKKTFTAYYLIIRKVVAMLWIAISVRFLKNI